ncbi:MAG: Ig-like domain-containing protein [Mobilitalea sp.]
MDKQRKLKKLLKMVILILAFVMSFNVTTECKAAKNVINIKKAALTIKNQYIEEGDTFKVNVQITPKNATYKNFTWSVSNEESWYPAVEQVSKNKFKAVGTGKATIIAYQKQTKKKYKLKIEVKAALGAFHMEADNNKVTALTTFVGGHLLINGKMDNADDYWYEIVPEFKYSIANTNIATIDNRGQVTAVATGDTSITVTAQNGKSVSCKLSVTGEKEELRFDTMYADNLFDKVGTGNYGDWSNWANADNTFIFSLANNQIGIFNHKSTDNNQSIQLYLYDQDLHYISSKTIGIPYTEWGGMYQGEDGNYYIAVGQTNENQDNSKIVYSILKLDADFNEIGRCNISGTECSTRIPYDVGDARMTMSGTTLIVHTDRERYTSSDGRNHQSNITFVIDSTTMQQSYVGELFPYNHVSHSFNQFVKMDGNNLIYVDHGDAYPRSVVAQTHYNFSAFGWGDDYSSRPNTQELNLLNIVGETGDNYTGTKVNGFELGSNNNIVAGVSIPHDTIAAEALTSYDAMNVYVSLLSKDGTRSELRWLTNYQNGSGYSANNLRMVKISENEFALVYRIVHKEEKATGLIIIDSSGNVLKKKEYQFFFSFYTQPIYYDNAIVWIDSNSYGTDTWYDESESKLEECQFTRIYLK